MQVTDRKGNHATPLASAICWKCCKTKSCDTMRGDLHKVFHRFLWKKLVTDRKFALRAQAGRMPALRNYCRLPARPTRPPTQTLFAARDAGERRRPGRSNLRVPCVEHGGGAAVADAQTALQHRRRSALHLDANAQRLFKQLVVFAAGIFQSQRFFVGLRDGFVVVRLPLRS